MWYTACTQCKKKINPTEVGYNGGGGYDEYGQQAPSNLEEKKGPKWHCEKCNQHFEDCNYTWNFSMKIGDESDSVYAQVLGEYPGDDIIGMNALSLR